MSMLSQIENSLIFPAPRYPVGDWHPTGLDQEEVHFQSADGTKLHGWYVTPPQPIAQVLHCHGNGEHVAYLADLLRFFRDEWHLAIFAWDYRGYGRSEGTPDELGVLADAAAAQRWLAQRAGISEDQVVLLGRSLGGATAIDLAVARGTRGLVLESTFTSMREMAAYHFPWLPVRQLMRSQFLSLEKIRRYEGPLLISHAVHDEIVPYEMGQRLFAAAGGHDKTFFSIPTGGHNDLPPIEYYAALREFLSRLS